MKILVTGATGFIGRYVVNELLQNTSCNIVIATRSQNPELAWMATGRLVCLQFDFENLADSVDYFDYFQRPEICIHLAWPGLPNYKAPFHLVENLPQQYHFLKNLVVNGLKRLTVTGTCFEYGMQEGCLSENLPAHPDNAYAQAKYQLYLLLTALQQEYPFQLNWLRLFYMYGRGQNAKSLFSQLEAALERGDADFNMSGGEQERDFLPVETVAKNIVQTALADREAGLVNCCSGQPVKVKDWVAAYLEQHNAFIKLNLGFYPYADYEPMSFWGDKKKLDTILNKRNI
ncbi:MAG: NAD(P)-dependent oxidoreductase [Chitinophagaceae bacterium]